MEINWKSWKPGFQWNDRLKNTFLRDLKYFFSIYSSVITAITPKIRKNISEKINKKNLTCV